MHRPILSPVTSCPVITAFTPGTCSALLTSMLLMRPDEIGLLRHLPQSVPGNFTSALYCAIPVTLSLPSTPGSLVPLPESMHHPPTFENFPFFPGSIFSFLNGKHPNVLAVSIFLP